VFLRHLYIKTMVSPRQARDKHRENSKSDDGAGSGGGMAGADGRMAAAYLLWTILFFENQIKFNE
jgi:hypothetical protein